VRVRPLALALSLLLVGAAGAHAQAARPRGSFSPPDTVRHVPNAAVVGLLSAAIPGAGEYALHLDRWVPQIALELVAWWQYRAHRREGRAYERQYRLLACQVARRIAPGECRDTSDFEYYETMGKPAYSASGSYDGDPETPGLQPETDPSSYNGHVWQLANELHVGDAANALAYYRTHAIPEAYSWNWGGNTLEQTVYDELIRRGDDAFRTSSRILGLILASHVTSAVDAYVAARLRELARAPSLELHTGFEPGAGELRWRAGVTLRPGRH
jgi:hypothetical protein